MAVPPSDSAAVDSGADLRNRLATTESQLRRVLDQLARAEGELVRLRSSTQIEARRGY